MFIEVWYYQYSNSWIIQKKDREGNQIGEADYIHSKRDALKLAESYLNENEFQSIKVFKRNGDLQKETIREQND